MERRELQHSLLCDGQPTITKKEDVTIGQWKQIEEGFFTGRETRATCFDEEKQLFEIFVRGVFSKDDQGNRFFREEDEQGVNRDEKEEKVESRENNIAAADKISSG